MVKFGKGLRAQVDKVSGYRGIVLLHTNVYYVSRCLGILDIKRGAVLVLPWNNHDATHSRCDLFSLIRCHHSCGGIW